MSYWAAAQLQANREQLALHVLQRIEGFTVYAPRLRPQRRRRHGRWIETTPLLFVTFMSSSRSSFSRARSVGVPASSAWSWTACSRLECRMR